VNTSPSLTLKSLKNKIESVNSALAKYSDSIHFAPPRKPKLRRRVMKCLGMRMRLNLSALVPGREQCSAVATPVLNVLERVHHVGNEAEAPSKTESNGRPNMSGVSGVVADTCHRSLATVRAIHWRSSHPQIRNGNRALKLL